VKSKAKDGFTFLTATRPYMQIKDARNNSVSTIRRSGMISAIENLVETFLIKCYLKFILRKPDMPIAFKINDGLKMR
jgi:hypothetical protein